MAFSERVPTFTNRSVAVGACTVGVMQVFVGTFAAVCSFLMLGGFCSKLECGDVHQGIGFWLAFPLLVPGLIGLVVLATRHIKAALTFLIINVAMMFLAVAHAIIVWKDYDDFWGKHRNDYRAGRCSPNGIDGCSCDGKIFPYECNLIIFGYELNWILFGLSIAAIALCFVGSILGLLGGFIMVEVKPKRSS